MSNNINGGGRSRNAMSAVDFYRRVPKDLTEVCSRKEAFLIVRIDRPYAVWYEVYEKPLTIFFVSPSENYIGNYIGSSHVHVRYRDHGYFVFE
jgi:hypothetical protein